MVLGANWLSTLGDITWNFRDLTMKFQQQGKPQCLRGLQTGKDNLLEPDSKEWRQKTQFYIIQLCTTELKQSTTGTLSSLTPLLLKYRHLFDEPTGLPPKRDFDHKIPLIPGASPVCQRPYRHPYVHKNEIEKQVQDMLTSGIIRPSTSSYSSPVILVKKTDGTWRMCVDYRALNQSTVKDKFPIPFIDELFDELHGAKYFSKLDLRAGYHQVRVVESDVHKTAFRTHEGHYEFLVMPFGLTNAPSTFQAMMNSIFKDYMRKFVLIFFDDILIYSRSLEEHLVHLEKVFCRLAENQLKIKESKCQFASQKIGYLGHVISQEGVQVDTTKTEAIEQWPIPTNLKELRGFLGLTGYYRRFIKDYGSVAGPMTDLLKKNAFQWNDKAQEAFEKLKKKLTNPLVLVMPNFSATFVLECDASGEGIGAVLMQEGRPIAYLSQKLKGRVKDFSTYEKEMLAVLLAIKKWNQYLWGREFIIKTDHQALKYMLEQKVCTEAQHKWISKLQGYHYKVEYKKGKENVAADSLSRRSEAICNVVTLVQPDWIHQFQEEMKQSQYYQEQLKKWEQGTLDPSKYYLRGRLLYYKKRLLLDPRSQFVHTMLQEHHSSLQAGHSGVAKTLHRLKKSCYWKGMKTAVKEFIRSCEVCQRNKHENLSPAGLLQPLPIPKQIWEDLSMDFIEGLPPSHHKTTIMVVVDKLTKYIHLFALCHPYTAAMVAHIFIDGVFKLHGMPRSIVCDRDPIFTSQFWHVFFKAQGTQLKHSTAYHPQTDGQTEVTNRSVEAYMRCFCGHKPKEWSKFLLWAEHWFNTNWHSSTRITPFEAVYRRPPPHLLTYVPDFPRDSSVAEALHSRDNALQLLKDNLHMA